MSHNEKLSRAGLPSVETLTRRILRVWSRATESDIEAGARWYDEAGSIAAEIASESDATSDDVAAVIAHLSPRQSWARNVLAARAMVVDNVILPGVMSREAARAVSVLSDNYDDNVDSFSGQKTRRFYLNIIGDREAVTVDVWASRVAGVDESLLNRVGVYDAVEHAYRLAARRRAVDPATMQATTWVVARGGRAS